MRNKLSFDLQLSARKAAIAERIYFLPYRYRRCPVFTGINPSGGWPLLYTRLYFAGGLRHQPVHLVGNDGDGKKSGRY